MGKHDRCCVAGCHNNNRHPERFVVRPHVPFLKLHCFPKNEERREIWKRNIRMGHADFDPGKYTYVCSNHFVGARPTPFNPYPTLYLTEAENKNISLSLLSLQEKYQKESEMHEGRRNTRKQLVPRKRRHQGQLLESVRKGRAETEAEHDSLIAEPKAKVSLSIPKENDSSQESNLAVTVKHELGDWPSCAASCRQTTSVTDRGTSCESAGTPGDPNGTRLTPKHSTTLPSDDCFKPSPAPDVIFEQITREVDIQSSTGLPNAESFKFLFNFLASKAATMTYWRGEAQILKGLTSYAANLIIYGQGAFESQQSAKIPVHRRGPRRKLAQEQELLMVLMRLKLGVQSGELAKRFKVSGSLVTSTLSTWIRFMAKELRWLVVWPNWGQVHAEMPDCFRMLYPKARCIVDCTELTTDKPSAPSTRAALLSDHTHLSTVKFLVSTTPKGSISFVSQCYGGSASDEFLMRDSGFLNCVKPMDQVLAKRQFNIKDELVSKKAKLCVLPCISPGMQKTAAEVGKLSNMANARMHVEQATKCLKSSFCILEKEMPLNCFALCDDIVLVCCALLNIKEHL